jgi:hypothetical protein
MKWVLSLSCLLLWAASVDGFACANLDLGFETGTKYDGSIDWRTGRSIKANLRYSLEKSLAGEGAELEERFRGRTEFPLRNKYAVALMYLGRSKEAITLLQQMESEKPGEYSVAANLGTAFELSGDNHNALHWIKEGIRRNFNSHAGTEWLHVKILEAKIAQEKDPNYFQTHSVLNLDPAKIDSGVIVDGSEMQVAQLIQALHYQLVERMKFVKPPDAPVGGLLYDLAVVEAATHTLEAALPILQMATEYGYTSGRVEPLRASFERRIAWARAKEIGIYITGGAAVVGLVIFAFRRRRIALSRRDLKG